MSIKLMTSASTGGSVSLPSYVDASAGTYVIDLSRRQGAWQSKGEQRRAKESNPGLTHSKKIPEKIPGLQAEMVGMLFRVP